MLKQSKLFRTKNNLNTFNQSTFDYMINQEMNEVLEATNLYHKIEECCDCCVLIINAIEQKGLNAEGIINAFNQPTNGYSDFVIAVNNARIALSYSLSATLEIMRDVIFLNGFNFELAMLETYKKINSRKGAINETTGKWEKDRSQPKSELYTPDYSTCEVPY